MAPSTDEVLRKYSAKLDGAVRNFDGVKSDYTKSYSEFRASLSPQFSRYEKWCRSLGNVFKIRLGAKDSERIYKDIDTAHLQVTPSEVVGLSVMVMTIILFGGIFAFMAWWLIFGVFSFAFFGLVLVIGVFSFFYLQGAPARLALFWRLKASSQMVPAILYLVIYMKHTSNFEKAMAFAAENLDEPLGGDFAKLFYDVQVGKYSTIKDAVDNYLERWRDYSLEFIEAFHLIESSLFEPTEGRRVAVLERAMSVILDGVYDKMLKYTHDAKSPLTNVYMLGIVLPTLGLAILPLASIMVSELIGTFHIMIIFNLIVPFMVLYLTQNVLAKRPGGYGDTSLLEKNPKYYLYVSRRPYYIAAAIAFPVILLGLLPLIWMYTPVSAWLGLQIDYTWVELGLGFMGTTGAFGIVPHPGTGNLVGPYGILSLLLSLFVPLGMAIFFIIAHGMRTKELLVERDKYKEVEEEFTSSLFQLGNRIGDGLPAEVAFGKVMDSSRGTATEGFFRVVNENINSLGMSLDRALFDPKRGAVVFYPSHLVATSMKVLSESVKKGLKVAARSLMSISDYVKNIRKVNIRLNDLLADIISDMKSNMSFLAPLLSGVIVGLSGMITLILSNLEGLTNTLSGDGLGTGGGGIGNLLGIFQVTEMIPSYWLQVIVGIYLIQIVFILTGTLVVIQSGKDDLAEIAEVGRNLRNTMLLYFVVAFGSIVGLALVGGLALAGLAG
ncbi:MAG: Flp pilus assembly protein TadB [Patescibacteria group bacterium]|jgi:Flp pilus assembly protein TadB